MKKTVLIIGVLSFFTLLLAGAPKIKFEQEEISFGEIDDGQTIKLVFQFQNNGDGLLLIKNIRSSCGCAVAQLKKRRYKPGERGEIPVTFISRGYGGRKVTKTITITTNDPEQSYIRLKISGNVTLKNFARIEIHPSRIKLKKNPNKKQYEGEFEIKNTGNIDLEIKELSHIPEIITVFSSTRVKPGNGTGVRVIFKVLDPARKVSFLKIRSNDYRRRYTLVRIEIP